MLSFANVSGQDPNLSLYEVAAGSLIICTEMVGLSYKNRWISILLTVQNFIFGALFFYFSVRMCVNFADRRSAMETSFFIKMMGIVCFIIVYCFCCSYIRYQVGKRYSFVEISE